MWLLIKKSLFWDASQQMMCDGWGDGCYHLTMSPLEGRKETRAWIISTELGKTRSRGNNILEVGIANRRRRGGEQWRRVFKKTTKKNIIKCECQGEHRCLPQRFRQITSIEQITGWDMRHDGRNTRHLLPLGSNRLPKPPPVIRSIKLTSLPAWPPTPHPHLKSACWYPIMLACSSNMQLTAGPTHFLLFRNNRHQFEDFVFACVFYQ